MIKTNKRGFTLIELLVVIAIIGILSAVVLASLNTARSKGSNAAVKSNLSSLRAQGEIVYDAASPTSYDGVCDDPKVRSGLDAAGLAGGGLPADAICNDSNLSWAAQSPLKVPDADGSTYWCVDSVGTSKGETLDLGVATVCS